MPAGADDDDDIGLLSSSASSKSSSSSPLSAKGAWYRVHVSSRLQVLATRLRPVAGLLFCALAQVFFSVMSLSAKMLGRRLPTAQLVFVRASIQLLITDSLSLWYRCNPLHYSRFALTAAAGTACLSGAQKTEEFSCSAAVLLVACRLQCTTTH